MKRLQIPNLARYLEHLEDAKQRCFKCLPILSVLILSLSLLAQSQHGYAKSTLMLVERVSGSANGGVIQIEFDEDQVRLKVVKSSLYSDYPPVGHGAVIDLHAFREYIMKTRDARVHTDDLDRDPERRSRGAGLTAVTAGSAMLVWQATTGLMVAGTALLVAEAIILAVTGSTANELRSQKRNLLSAQDFYRFSSGIYRACLRSRSVVSNAINRGFNRKYSVLSEEKIHVESSGRRSVLINTSDFRIIERNIITMFHECQP